MLAKDKLSCDTLHQLEHTCWEIPWKQKKKVCENCLFTHQIPSQPQAKLGVILCEATPEQLWPVTIQIIEKDIF